MANRDEIATKLSESAFTLRTKSVHSYYLDALRENVDNGRIYGAIKECALLKLNYFDIQCTFPPDIMHDLMEGVFPAVLHNILRSILHERYVTILLYLYLIESWLRHRET